MEHGVLTHLAKLILVIVMRPGIVIMKLHAKELQLIGAPLLMVVPGVRKRHALLTLAMLMKFGIAIIKQVVLQ